MSRLDPEGSITESLLVAVRKGGPGSWERLVALYGPTVYRWCRQQKLQPDDAKDVSQEVFQAVYRNIDRFRRDRPDDSFTGWVRTITRNKLIDHFRKRQRHPPAAGGSSALTRIELETAIEPLADDFLDPPGISTEHELLHRALHQIKERFLERTFRAFWLTEIEGRDSVEVANELGMKPSAVREAKRRVLCRFRQEFGDILRLSIDRG